MKSNSYTNIRKSVIVHNLHQKTAFQMYNNIIPNVRVGIDLTHRFLKSEIYPMYGIIKAKGVFTLMRYWKLDSMLIHPMHIQYALVCSHYRSQPQKFTL